MPWKNKLVWISPEGKIIQEYFKSKPAPPLEPIIPGKGAVPIVNTTFGKIASVICADQNYPNFIRQTGNGKAGLLLVPSLDWKAVSPLHSRMGIFRAIENGCSMIKATGEGLSIAVDYTGATLTTLDYWNNTDNVMHSNVSIINTPTFYSKMGDILAWVSIFGLTAISGFLFFTQSTIDKEK
jgi:apolipoprotein N-acyltransferase